MAQGRNKTFEDFLDAISQGEGEMTDLLIAHQTALTAHLDNLFIVVTTANNTKQNFIDALALIPGAEARDNGISDKGKAELAAQLFGAYQVNRIRTENADDEVISELLEQHEDCTPILAALVKHFGSLPDSNAVNNIFDHLEGGDLQDAIYAIPGLTDDDKGNLVKAFFGKNQYNRMLSELREEGNHDILIAQLDMHKDDIKQRLGEKEDQAQVTDLIDSLSNTNNDKAQTLAAMKALGMKDPGDLGILNDARDAIYGENQYRRIRATPPLQIRGEDLPIDSVLLDQLAHRKANVCRLLGQQSASKDIDFLINAVKNLNANKDQIGKAMNSIGLDGNTPDNVNRIFGENQYRKLCITETDPLLAELIRARPAEMKNALASVVDNHAIDDINGIDNLVDNLSNPAKTKAEIGADMVTLGLVAAADANANAVNARYGAVQYDALPEKFKELYAGRVNEARTALGAHPETDTKDKINGLRAALSDATKSKAEIGEVMITLGIVAGPYNAANEVISHYYGELQYNRVIAINHPENTALDVQLRSPDRKNQVIEKLGGKDDVVEVDELISDVTRNDFTKNAVRNSMADLGLDPANVNAIYGENAYNYYLTDNNTINSFPAFHAQFSQPGQKNNIINMLGAAASVSTLVKAVTNKKSDKADIASAMTEVGLNAAVPANVDAVFGENQYWRILAEAHDSGNAQLKSLLVDNVAAAPLIKDKLGKKSTIAEVDVTVTAIQQADIATLPAKIQDLGVPNVSPDVAKSIFIDTQYSRILNDASASGNEPLTKALADNADAVKTKLGEAATFDAANVLIKNIQSADKTGLSAALAALDIPAPVNPGDFFADTQYSRIRAEANAKGNTVFVDELDRESVSVKAKLKSLNSAKDVDKLVNAIFDAGRVELQPALQALGITPPLDIDPLLGEVRHHSLLVGAEKESNPALFQALKVNAPRVKNVLALLVTTEDTDPLIDAINHADKPDLTVALNNLGITEIPNLNGIFGETQYDRMIADSAVLPDPSALRTLMSDDANKETFKIFLGNLPNIEACNQSINYLRNKNLDRNQIGSVLTDHVGFDAAISSAAAKTLYAENQCQRVLAAEYANHATLSALIKSEDGKTALTKIFQHDAFATIGKVDAMLNTLQSVKTKNEVTHALSSMGLTPTPEQIDAIVQENRQAAHAAADHFDPAQPKPPALAEFKNLSPDMDSLKKQLARAEAMQTFVKTALHSRTELTDPASLETIDNTVQKSIIYLKACAKQCDHDIDIANAGALDVTELNNRKLKIEEALALFRKIEASLRKYIDSDKTAGPQKIAVIGQAGAEATVHQPNNNPVPNESYLRAADHLEQFFAAPVTRAVAGFVLPAQPDPKMRYTLKWDEGVSRSVTNEIDFDYKQAVTGKVIPASVKTGLIQTEVKQYVDGPSSYRQDFFFEAKGFAKMRKGERQFAPPHKTPNIPADHVMRWANDAVRNFMAFADTKDKLITINAGDMPKCCLEALAIMSEAHGLRYEMKGAILGMDARERAAKVDLTKQIYGTQLQTAQEVTSSNIVSPRPGRS